MTLAEIETLAIVSERLSSSGCGYCEVASLSEPGTTHRVYVSNKLYSVKCDCKGAQRGYDCGHRLATDRHLDSRRGPPAKDAERSASLDRDLAGGICSM